MKDIIIVTGGSNGLDKAIVDNSLNNNLIVCNLDKDKLDIDNENYKDFVGDISDEDFVKNSINEISKCGYTESLKTAYKGTPVKIIGVYPGGINTNFYVNSRDYVSIEKQNTFMNPHEVAKIICDNIFSDLNLNVADIIIERN